MTTRRYGELEAAVRRDLRQFRPDARRSALAVSALVIARRVDDGPLEPRELAALAGRLESVLEALARMSPPVPVKDGIDDLAGRRAARRAS
jgi:hypothetical protein